MNTGDLAISIDLGGTQIRAALVDRTSAILQRTSELTRATAGPEIVIGQIASLAAQVSDGVDQQHIVGAGVSSPGPIDTKSGMALNIPTLAGFADYPLLTKLIERLAMPVHLENDAIAAAIGEWRFGAGKGCASIVYVTVSTGLGGGVIVDNQVLRGKRGLAGHVGHMTFVMDGELCGCGNAGCFEAYASGTAFTNRAIAAAADAQTSLGKDGKAIDAAAVFAAAREGDSLARSLVALESDYLGRGFASLMHLYSPDVLIMGGGLSNCFDDMRDGIMRAVETHTIPAFKGTPIICADLGDNSGLIGAASLVFEAKP